MSHCCCAFLPSLVLSSKFVHCSFSEHFENSSFVHKILVRQKIGDLVVFWPHILSEMKINFGDIEIEQELGDEKIKLQKMVI